ncbi:hypothetical protein LUZ60_006903 [Juncus effusus]|nr:hypothetical protein LUZ60_006903 [Juncus effusus]
MADDLFAGLPPPSAPARRPSPPSAPSHPPPPAQAPAPALKSALKRKQAPPSSSADSANQVNAPELKSAMKRDKPSASFSVSAPPDSNEEATNKKLRFRTSTDQSSQQITEAMLKITTHIKNPSKFSKASKLAVHLMQTGSVKKETSEGFFAILEAAMGDLANCNAPPVRKDYWELFTAAQDAAEYFSKKQKNQLAIWTLHAVVANDLHTDDSFVFSKTVTKIKEAILNLPPATPEEDIEESDSLSLTNQENQENNASSASENTASSASADPFGLDDLFSEKAKRNEKVRSKELNRKEEEEESKRFLKAQRVALLKCLEIAAKRYKLPWTQTTIDILAKHAFDHADRFTKKQREAIESLWGSIKDQQIRRKQGKSVNGKLDVNGFEWLQEKYSNEKISIRRAVGGGGGRHCEQWLG